MVALAALALLMPVAPGASGTEEPRRAEYAVRWNPAEGGPPALAEVLALLGAPPGESSACEVRYFELPRPATAPPGAAVVLRRRSCEDGRAEIRLKYRSPRPLAGDWACPAGIPFRRQAEVDVGFGGSDAPSRVYSYSCTLEAPEPPASLGAVPRKCASRMVRSEAGSGTERFKVETWTLPDGGTRIELSRSAANSVDELARFEELVERLRAKGARPLKQSKTELGSRCP